MMDEDIVVSALATMCEMKSSEIRKKFELRNELKNQNKNQK